MEPLKVFYPLATWLLRISVIALTYIIFFLTLRTPDFHNLEFYIAAAFSLFAILLFIGGFMNKSSMTIVSAIFLSLGCMYKIFMHFVFSTGHFVTIYGIFAAISLFFVAAGNRKK